MRHKIQSAPTNTRIVKCWCVELALLASWAPLFQCRPSLTRHCVQRTAAKAWQSQMETARQRRLAYGLYSSLRIGSSVLYPCVNSE